MTGSYDCWLGIRANGGTDLCSGGFNNDDGNGGDDPFWWVQCDEESCSAGVRCWDGEEREGNGEYSCLADENGLRCYDNGGSFPTVNNPC